MKLFYFVGGPMPDDTQAFIQRLAQIGGPPPGWRIYPHASGTGQALHVVEAENPDAIVSHLSNFLPGYRRGPIVEVVSS